MEYYPKRQSAITRPGLRLWTAILTAVLLLVIPAFADSMTVKVTQLDTSAREITGTDIIGQVVVFSYDASLLKVTSEQGGGLMKPEGLVPGTFVSISYARGAEGRRNALKVLVLRPGSTPEEPLDGQAARDCVDAFLNLVNAGRYDEACGQLPSVVPKQELVKRLEAVVKTFGPASSRQFKSVTPSDSRPNSSKKGQYLIFEYRTNFAKFPDTPERVFVERVTGKWQVVSWKPDRSQTTAGSEREAPTTNQSDMVPLKSDTWAFKHQVDLGAFLSAAYGGVGRTSRALDGGVKLRIGTAVTVVDQDQVLARYGGADHWIDASQIEIKSGEYAGQLLWMERGP